jgi:hypothetical protein
MKRSKKPSRHRVRERTRALRRAINALDFVASGTVHQRTKVCGRKNCRCAVDPAARHGPYYEWTRRQDGRLLHSVVTPEQAELLTRAIQNYRQIQQFSVRWEHETAQEVLIMKTSHEVTAGARIVTSSNQSW